MTPLRRCPSRAQIHTQIGHIEKSLVEAEELLDTSNPSPLAAAG
jgi:hypothetical protein